MAGLDDSFECWGGAVDGRYLVSYESGDDHFDWTEGYQGRNQFLIALPEHPARAAPGLGRLLGRPARLRGRRLRSAPCSGCTVTVDRCRRQHAVLDAGVGELHHDRRRHRSWPASRPTATAACCAAAPAAPCFNGDLARFTGTGIKIRDAWTDSLRLRDSLNITNLILAENGPSATPTNYDADGADLLGACPAEPTSRPAGASRRPRKFAASNHQIGTAAASLITSLNPTGLDWTPKATVGQPDPTTGGSTVVPAHFDARTANFFGAAHAEDHLHRRRRSGGSEVVGGLDRYNIN